MDHHNQRGDIHETHTESISGRAAAESVTNNRLAVPKLQAYFFNQIKLGVEGYAAKLGIEVITVHAKNDTTIQVSQVGQVQDLIIQGIDAAIQRQPFDHSRDRSDPDFAQHSQVLWAN